MIKNRLIILLVIGWALGAFSCAVDGRTSGAETVEVVIINPASQARKDEIIRLDTRKLAGFLPEINLEELTFSVPYQFNDQDRNGQADELLLLMDLTAGERKQIPLQALLNEDPVPEFAKRTHAEISHKKNGKWVDREYLGGDFVRVNHLKVPPQHTDHSWFIRYEGPGWESDKIGYRFYLDWRNATDIFGKKTRELVLHEVGLDGFDSYHEPADWGMDVLRVGPSLGIGSLGRWIDGKAVRIEETDSLECSIVYDGIIQSKVRTVYHGWTIAGQKVDLVSDLSINAGSRLTHHQVRINQNIPNLCTGIVKHEKGELISRAQQGVSGWGYLATYGKQSLADDYLGMALIFRNNDLINMTEDENSHVVILKPKFLQLDYYFLAAWQQEPGGIDDRQEFIDFLDREIERLNRPTEVILTGGGR